MRQGSQLKVFCSVIVDEYGYDGQRWRNDTSMVAIAIGSGICLHCSIYMVSSRS